jgi:Protein of unknown function (DUF3108)
MCKDPGCRLRPTRHTLYSDLAAGEGAPRLTGTSPLLVISKPEAQNAVPAALAAAACVMIGALAADATRTAGAQGRLEAEYSASVGGIPLGQGNWIVDIADDQFTAAASGTTSGIVKFFTGAHGTGSSRGTVSGGQPVPTGYAATIHYDKKIDDVHIALAGGNVTDYTVEPPLPPHPDRIPVTDADRRGVLDPLTSTLNRVPGDGDPVSPEACNRMVSVFDGRLRYDLHSAFKRMEMVKAERGYQGPVVVCAVYFTPISGYLPGRPIINYLVSMRDAEVWLAPISGTHVLAPFRFSIPTPIGLGLLQATQFVSVTSPSRSTAAKTQ